MMNRSVLELYLMGAYNRSKVKQKEVETKVLAGQCLTPECNHKPKSRGLCDACRNARYYEIEVQETDAAKAKYESQLVAEGLMLMPGEQVKIKRAGRSPLRKLGVA
jgi:hypothetical protein